MRRWLIFLLMALLVTTGCAAAGASTGGSLGNLFSGGGIARRPPAPPPLPEAALDDGKAAAKVLIDGGEILPALLDSIRQARQQIDVEMYEFGDARLRDALAERARKGVSVRVILDATEPQSQALAQDLQARKIAVRFYQVSGGIDHVKLLVADDTVVIGGMNWGKNSMLNHDYDVLIQHAPGEFRDLFERDWEVAGGGSAPPPASRLLLYDDHYRTAFAEHVAQAKRSIWVEMDELSDPDALRALTDAAQRGVDVRVLLDPSVTANQASAATLQAGGLGVRWYYTDVGRLHAKAVLIDGQHLLIGSANLTHRAFWVNHEAGVDLHAPPLAQRVRDAMDNNWKHGIPARPAS